MSENQQVAAQNKPAKHPPPAPADGELEEKAVKAAPKPPTVAQEFAHVVAEFMAGNPVPTQPGLPPMGNTLAPRSAAILCAHLVFERGGSNKAREISRGMTKQDARRYADAFTTRHPAAWGALTKQDILRFQKVLNASGVMTDTTMGYQTMTETLLKA